MNDFLIESLSGYLGLFLVAVGLVLFIYGGLALQSSPLRTAWVKYIAILDEDVRFLFLDVPASRIAIVQGFAIGGAIGAFIGFGQPTFIILALLIAVVPKIWLSQQRTKRELHLELQLINWLQNLANALKATPAIGEALRSTAELVQPPMQQEVDLMVKENQLGTPVDQAVLNASERIGSPIISGSLATIVIARQTGGDLPKILESSSATLREMARLEGVVRTKTAEGKGQVMVMGLLPFILVGILLWMQPDWFDSMVSNFIGNMMIAVAMCLWGGALFWARQILKVDI